MTHTRRRRHRLVITAELAGVCGCRVEAGTTEQDGTSSTTHDETTVSSPSSSTTSMSSSSTSSTTSTTGDSGDSEGSSSTGSADVMDPGCVECVVLVDNLVGGRGITFDDTHVYFTDQSQGTVARIQIGGGEGGVLVDEQDIPYDIVVDATHVY